MLVDNNEIGREMEGGKVWTELCGSTTCRCGQT